jgi:hypothetical protein
MFLDNNPPAHTDSESFQSCSELDRPFHQPRWKPNRRSLIRFRNIHPELFLENPEGESRDRFEFNLLNMNCYMDNWDRLSPDMRMTLYRFVNSDLLTNCYRYGMKEQSVFKKHLLLLAGSEIWNIRPHANTNMVLSNLKELDGRYSRFTTPNSIIDARTCRQLGFNFLKDHDFPLLFTRLHAQVILFESDESYRHVPDNLGLYRERVRAFNRTNVEFLKTQQRRRKITSFLYSHEVSCDSILGMRFRPHTHAVVFFEPGVEPPYLASDVKFQDRMLKSLPKIHRNFSTIKDFINYLHLAYSLAEVYEREYRPEQVRDLNINTVKALRTLIDVHGKFIGDGCIKRFGKSAIPLKGSSEDFLKKILKEPKKKKTKTK